MDSNQGRFDAAEGHVRIAGELRPSGYGQARLALLGVEASIQTTSLPDKGVWHRVRIGPYTSVEQLDRARDTLKHNGVETALIKVRENR